MMEKIQNIVEKLAYLHPFLFAIYPVLFLFSYNINLYRLSILLFPILISLVFATLVVLLCLLIFRKIQPAAILASSVILIFFSYSRVQDQIKNIYINLGFVIIGPDKLIFILVLIGLVTLFVMVLKLNKYLSSINKILGIISITLVVITIISILNFEYKNGRILNLDAILGTSDEQLVQTSEQKPDIYYIVFEDYAGDKTLKLYGFDNSNFLNYLKNSDFYVASDATSNYPKTFLSMASTLNMEYMDYLTAKTKGGATSDQSIVTPIIKNNKVVKFLKSNGYKYIHIGSGWDPTRSNKNADINYVLKGGSYLYDDEFSNGLLHTTLAAPILHVIFPDPTAVSENPKDNEERRRVLFEFQSLDEVQNIQGPKFVFFHILSPHDPYVFDKDCNPISEEITDKKSETANYIDQLQCMNKKMKVVLDNIFSKSNTPPIIILTTDEGVPRPQKNILQNKSSWKDASDASLNEKFPILAAYYFPGLKKNPLYPGITPVNNFRVLFNAYFNTNYPLLDDKNYIFEDEKNYYKFIDVTEKINTNY